MWLFAHVGIPTGMVWLCNKATARGQPDAASPRQSPDGARQSNDRVTAPAGIFSRVDYRLLMLGTILPDLIDKPLGAWILGDTLSDTRVYTHTMLFILLLAIVGTSIYLRTGKQGGLWLTFGCFTHLCLDQMWLNPRTLLWPIYGWSFQRMNLSNWLENGFSSLATKPTLYIPEIIGAIILALFFIEVLRQGKLSNLLRTGKVAW
jgi:inner membrane protein